MNILKGWFYRRPVPSRPPAVNSRDFTNLVVNAMQYAWSGGGLVDADPASAGGVAVAAGAYARAFSAATVTGPAAVVSALQDVLACAGGAYARDGEFVARVHFHDDELRLRPVQIVDGEGPSSSPVWTVREAAPSGDYKDVKVAAADLLHVVWHPDESTSGLRGEPPWCGGLGRAAANVEDSMAREARLPVGHSLALSSASEWEDDAVDEFYDGMSDLVQTSSKTGFMPLLVQGASAIGGGGGSGGSFLKRFGSAYAAASPQLQAELTGAVLASCGVPPLLLSRSLAGSALRDAWRAFLSSACQPVADQLARAASRTFAADIEIAVSSPSRHQTPADLVSRARAVGSLVNAGIEPDRALEIAGLA